VSLSQIEKYKAERTTPLSRYKLAHLAWRKAYRLLRIAEKSWNAISASEDRLGGQNDRLFRNLSIAERKQMKRWLTRLNRTRPIKQEITRVWRVKPSGLAEI